MDILKLVQRTSPITGDQIAEELCVSKPTLRADLALLVMLGVLDAKPKVGYFLGSKAPGAQEIPLQLQNMKVKDVQTLPVIVRETTSVYDAVITMFIENVGGLIVCDDGCKLQGVVSRKDLLKVTVGNSGAQAMPVSMIMTRQPNIVTVTPEANVLEAARLMIRHQVDSLPIVLPVESANEPLEVVGRITKTTMTHLLVKLALGS